MTKINDWWAGLTVARKERIASKIEKRDVYYPKCTEVWNNLSEERKKEVYEHCVNGHGYLENKEQDGKTMSY